MNHKTIIAANLRDGLREIKAMYRQSFYATTAFSEQWQLLIIKESYDIDWHEHRSIVDRDFAWKSQKLLNRIKGAK